jgi:exodeoxyribonuclease VII large subunit
MELIATGDLDLYAPNGSYSLVVKKIEPVGLGGLQLAYEQLKAQFDAEGLFNADRKQALPEFPFRIGIVTASTGAVIHDMMRVIRRKNPFVDVILYPAKVQGDGASEEIATGIRALEDESLELDAIIVARGGGSFEDLFCFSEEPVVRAIADCRLPVVTAIGHEPDYGLADAVADFSAATPTMAADTLVPDGYKMQEVLVESGKWLAEQVERQLLLSEENVSQLGDRLLDRITPKIATAEQALTNLKQGLIHAVEVRLNQAEHELDAKEGELNAYSPSQILRRGFSVLTHAKDGRVVRTLADLEGHPDLRLQLADAETTLQGYSYL